MRLFKRGSTYWFELVYQGQRIQKSTRVKKRRAAEDIAAAFRTALAKGDVGIVSRKRPPNFDKAMEAFLAWSDEEHRSRPKTAERYRYSSKALLRQFRDTPLDQITPESVERFKLNRASQNGSHTKRRLRPATVNRELACLKAVFNYAVKGDDHLRNPVNKVSFLDENNQQARVVSYQEQRTYLAAASPTLRDVATLIIETGMRPEEVFTLLRTDFNLKERYLTVQRGKTPAAKRRIALTKAAEEVVRDRLRNDGKSPYLFPHDTDAKRPMPNVHTAHHRALASCKLTPFRLYDLRHTWATRAAESGIDPVTLAAMLGHSRIQMVLRYAHPTQAHQSSAMSKLERYNIEQELQDPTNSSANDASGQLPS